MDEVKGNHAKRDRCAPQTETIFAALVDMQQCVEFLHSIGHLSAIHREAIDWAVEKAHGTPEQEMANGTE